MNRLTAAFAVLMFGGCLFSAVAEDAAGTPGAAAEKKVAKESTQGFLVSQWRKDLAIDGYFSGALTLEDVAAKLASVGCVPDGGWKLDQELTPADLKSIYKRMVGKDPEDGWASTDLVQKITDALKKAFAALKDLNERQPVSPTRPVLR